MPALAQGEGLPEILLRREVAKLSEPANYQRKSKEREFKKKTRIKHRREGKKRGES
ncbi:MAG: hypothetical protein Q8P67_27035 [archaeon]|nr:hypothetical protein [archaeon]